jgi:nucleotide-binding universal stress UspA family protein
MYKKIVAPLDGSELSECSLAHVKAVAKGCQATDVILLNVEEPGDRYAGYIEMSQEALRKIQQESHAQNVRYLAQKATQLKKNGLNAQTVILEGRPADEILNYVNQNKADLIIMSTHGSSGLTRWAFGSVADKVIRHSPVPVLVIAPAGCRK